MAKKRSAEPRVVVVAGGVTIDWNLARTPLQQDPDTPGRRGASSMSHEAGGAALLGRLMTQVAESISEEGGDRIDIHTVGSPQYSRPGDGASHHSYAIWSLYDREVGKKGPTVWRISHLLGIEAASPDVAAEWTSVVDDPATADLVVLDADLGASQRREFWPAAITASGMNPWVVLKMASPVGQGALWEHLVSHHSERLVVVVRANDLRITDTHISRALSWERTAQDLLWELNYNPEVKRLARCAHLIVSFGTSGAMLLSNLEDGRLSATLFFDPPVMEEEWAEKHPGGMVGYSTCLTAAIARQILIAPENPQLGEGITRGLNSMRNLHSEGYEVDDPARPQLRFPIERISQVMAESPVPFAEVPVREPAISGGPHSPSWTILEEVFTEGVEQVARRIVLEGPDRIASQVPVARFGKLLTVDRTEIEGYRSIRSLIAQYARQASPERPLSIAVFGRPGSGKSFGIKQIALSLFPGQIEPLTFNLSQFHTPDQLVDAFHQIRDVSLKGKLPLVFWDEFDASLGDAELGWLKQFLAPMQDGEFQQGQATHHIGAAIFVFAGGTKNTMEEFRNQFDGEGSERLAASKGRDFVSRLKGYVDVLGPNPIGGMEADPHYVIRRAILLRSMLQSKPDLFVEHDGKRELQIDAGVWRALLRVAEYSHGARSMESVIAMSLLDEKRRFERSSLPSADQLAIHVTPDFLDIVRSLIIEGRMLRELAEAVHVAYCAGMLGDGYTWSQPDDDYLERHELLRPFVGHTRNPEQTAPSLIAYENLDEDVKEQNEDFARDIPNKVEAIGYKVVLGGEQKAEDAFSDEVVELLAEQEHDRWMRLKLRQGWSWGPENDRERLLHPDMLRWGEMTEEEQIERYGVEWASRIGSEVLPEKEKEKDRVLSGAVTEILAQHGYRIEKIG